MAEEECGEVVQYVVHPALRSALDQWLAARGLLVQRAPKEIEGEDSLPTFFIFPTEETWRRAR